jgi:hypothetical protein
MEILQALKAFPGFVLGIVLGLLIAFLTQVEVFLFAVLGVLVGVAISPAAGASVAFGMYTVFYVVGQYVTLANRNFALFLSVMGDERYTD